MVTSSSETRLEAEDPVGIAKLKSDVVFGYGGKRGEKKLGDMLDKVLEGEEVGPGEGEGEEVLMKDVPEEELKP